MSDETAPANRIVSPEDLAGLIDGTLTPPERDRVLRALSRSDEAIRQLGDASAIVHELEGTELLVAARRPQRLRRWSRWRTAFVVVPALAAAGVAGVLVTRSEGGNAANVVGLARTVPIGQSGPQSMAEAFGIDWANPGWGDVRGEGVMNRPSARLFRMGVQLADMEVAHLAADTSAIRTTMLALRGVATTTAARAEVMAVEAHGVPIVIADRTHLANVLRTSEGKALDVWFDLGVWCESARLTTRSATPAAVAFFAPTGAAMRTLAGLLETSERNASQHDAILATLHLVAAHPVTSVADLSSMRSLLDTALQAGGR